MVAHVREEEEEEEEEGGEGGGHEVTVGRVIGVLAARPGRRIPAGVWICATPPPLNARAEPQKVTFSMNDLLRTRAERSPATSPPAEVTWSPGSEPTR